MTYKKRTIAGLTTASPATLGTVGLGAKYGVIKALRVGSYASSAKAAPGTDTSIRIKITDNNSDIVYLDAADRDYATAEVTLHIAEDDTATGTDTLAVDKTGATATAGAGHDLIVEGPLTVIVVNGGTATDYVEVNILVEV